MRASQRPRTIGTPAALMHILMGDPVNPQSPRLRSTPDRQRQGSRSRDGERLSSSHRNRLHQASRARRDRDAAGTGARAERNLFAKLCVSEPALARVLSYEGEHHRAVALYRGRHKE